MTSGFSDLLLFWAATLETTNKAIRAKQITETFFMIVSKLYWTGSSVTTICELRSPSNENSVFVISREPSETDLTEGPRRSVNTRYSPGESKREKFPSASGKP